MKMELLTSSEMKQAEQSAIEAGIDEPTLMENAGRGVVEVILNQFQPCKTLILCGPGNNGGDAQVVARLLNDMGWPIHLISLSNIPQCKEIKEILNQTDLIVDGLFGTGLSRSLEGEVHELVTLTNASHKPVVSIDIPSGIDSNSGTILGTAIQAYLTVTFCRAKPGHFLMPGRSHTGQLLIKDIGITDSMLPVAVHKLNMPSVWQNYLKEPHPLDHKYSRGACLIVGGGSMPGAIRLATSSARRVGAGLARILCKTEEYPIYATTAYGEIVTPVATAQEYLNWAMDKRFKALLWGAGAHPHESTREQAMVLLSTQKPLVLDGGALSSFEGAAQTLMGQLHSNVVLTPHEGEFIRLFPHLAFLNNKSEKARNAAMESGSVVVLKGYDTVIASPTGEVIINANAPATLATAGSGDVLAGMIVGLLAQELPPFYAAAAGVWIHSEAAKLFGLGLIAEDIIEKIPLVLQYLSELERTNNSIDNT